jgi:hypothetical protein
MLPLDYAMCDRDDCPSAGTCDRFQTPASVRRLWDRAKDYPADEQLIIKDNTSFWYNHFSPLGKDKCENYIQIP